MGLLNRPRKTRGTGRKLPIAALLDLLGHRWLLRVLWELDEDTLTFRALRARCDGMSPSVLNRRIAEMREAGIVETRAGSGYRVTREGREFVRMLRPMRGWAERQASRAPPSSKARSPRGSR